MALRRDPACPECARRTTGAHCGVAAALCGAALLACSGAGSGSAPALSDLTFSPGTALLNDGGGLVPITFDVELDDPDGDPVQFVIGASFGGTQLGTLSIPIQNPNHITRGRFRAGFTASTRAVGTYHLTFQAFDAKNHGSNVLEGTFSVASAPNPTPTPSPALTITSLVPSSAAAGGPAFTLVVNGSNFTPSSMVGWNGSPRPTTFLSATGLQAQISAADIATTATANVIVFDPSGPSNSLTFTVTVAPSPGVTLLALAANDLVFDPYQRKIYVSVPSRSPTNGNTITVVDRFAGTFSIGVFAGSDPNVLAISDDGQFLYAGLDGAASVRRFTLPAMAQDITTSLGQDPFFGPFVAKDIQVAPGAPHTIAVGPANLGFSPSEQGGIVIYDDGTARPTKAPGFSGTGNLFDSLQWGADATVLFAGNNEDTAFDFYALSVNAGGVSLVHDFVGALNGFGLRIHYDRVTNLVYTDGGRVVDPATGLPAGTFAASGSMIPDPGLNAAFFVTGSFFSSTLALQSFHLTHFTSNGSVNLTGPTGIRSRLVRFGPDGVAFLSTDDKVVLVRSSVVLPVAAAPNPPPAIASTAPAAAKAGSLNLKLAVTGSGFVPGAVVQWNGVDRTTDFVSATALTAYVPASDLAAAGTAQLTVVNPSPGGGASPAASFTITP